MQLKNDCRLQKCCEKYNNGDHSRMQTAVSACYEAQRRARAAATDTRRQRS